MSTLQKNIGDNLHAVKHAKKLPQAYLFFPSLRQNHQYLLLLLIQNMRLKFFFKKVTIIVWKLVSCACTFIYDKVKTKKKQKIPNLYLFEMSIPKLSKDCKADAFCTSPWTFYFFSVWDIQLHDIFRITYFTLHLIKYLQSTSLIAFYRPRITWMKLHPSQDKTVCNCN